MTSHEPLVEEVSARALASSFEQMRQATLARDSNEHEAAAIEARAVAIRQAGRIKWFSALGKLGLNLVARSHADDVTQSELLKDYYEYLSYRNSKKVSEDELHLKDRRIHTLEALKAGEPFMTPGGRFAGILLQDADLSLAANESTPQNVQATIALDARYVRGSEADLESAKTTHALSFLSDTYVGRHEIQQRFDTVNIAPVLVSRFPDRPGRVIHSLTFALQGFNAADTDFAFDDTNLQEQLALLNALDAE